MRKGPCSLCYSRAASVFVPAPTQHLVTWPIHGHVSQFSNRTPRLPAWRALRQAAVPLAASRHQRCTRIAHTWLRCCCTAARDVAWLLWCRGAVHRLGSMAHCVSLLLFLQWVSRGAVRQALLQMVHGTALLMVLGACASSCTSWCSAASRCVAAVQWTGLLSSHVRLASRTWSGPQAQSHAQCDLPLAWWSAQASSPGSCLVLIPSRQQRIRAGKPDALCDLGWRVGASRTRLPSAIRRTHGEPDYVPLSQPCRDRHGSGYQTFVWDTIPWGQCEYGYMGMHYGPSVIV